MAGYIPGEQPRPGQTVIKLNTNENPYPPSPRAMEVLRHFDGDLLRRYSQPMSGRVRQAVSQVTGFAEDWVLVGNGSDELLSMICKACCQKDRPAAYPMPTYVYYRTLAQVQDAPCVEVPFDDDYNLPLAGLVQANAAVTFISNPNSPSGTLTPLAELDELAGRLSGLLVIDEAYVDFAGQDSLSLVRKHPNVIVLRTLSKGYSLAGLRVGYGILPPALMPMLIKVKDHYNLSAIACEMGAVAIEDQAYMKANVAKIQVSRHALTEGLAGLGWRVWPSQSNFLLARPAAGNAEEIYQHLKKQGILVRYFNEPNLQDKLRITVGTDEQNGQLLKALRTLKA